LLFLDKLNVPLFKFRCNIFIGVRIIEEMPGSVASGTPCISDVQCGTIPGTLLLINVAQQSKVPDFWRAGFDTLSSKTHFNINHLPANVENMVSSE
jgi:hypothetical protein